MTSYALDVQTEGRFTLRTYPYFVQPDGAIEWAGEVRLGEQTLIHIIGARSRDEARERLHAQLWAIYAELGTVLRVRP